MGLFRFSIITGLLVLSLLAHAVEQDGCLHYLGETAQILQKKGSRNTQVPANRKNKMEWHRLFLEPRVSPYASLDSPMRDRIGILNRVWNSPVKEPLIEFFKKCGADFSTTRLLVPSRTRIVKQFSIEKERLIVQGAWPKELKTELHEGIVNLETGALDSVPWGTPIPNGFRKYFADDAVMGPSEYFQFFSEGKVILGDLNLVSQSKEIHTVFEHDLGHIVGLLSDPDYALALQKGLLENPRFLKSEYKASEAEAIFINQAFETYEGIQVEKRAKWIERFSNLSRSVEGPVGSKISDFKAPLKKLSLPDLLERAKSERSELELDILPLGGANADLFTRVTARDWKYTQSYSEYFLLRELSGQLEKEVKELERSISEGKKIYSDDGLRVLNALAVLEYVTDQTAKHPPEFWVEKFMNKRSLEKNSWLSDFFCVSGLHITASWIRKVCTDIGFGETELVRYQFRYE